MKYLSYNSKLKNFSSELRSNPTLSEIEMWKFLRENYKEYKFKRQKPIGNFIVDFYSKSLNLVIEIDGDVHLFQKQKDMERDSILLHDFNLKTLRFTNEHVLKYKDYLKQVIDGVVHLQAPF